MSLFRAKLLETRKHVKCNRFCFESVHILQRNHKDKFYANIQET